MMASVFIAFAVASHWDSPDAPLELQVAARARREIPSLWIQTTCTQPEDPRKRKLLEERGHHTVDWTFLDGDSGVEIEAHRSSGLVRAKVSWDLFAAGVERTVELFRKFVVAAVDVAGAHSEAFQPWSMSGPSE